MLLQRLRGSGAAAYHPGGLAPEELEHKFILVAIATSLVFWVVLGALTGAFFKRYANEAGAAA